MVVRAAVEQAQLDLRAPEHQGKVTPVELE